MTPEEKFTISQALLPLARIAQAYRNSGLNEARPEWADAAVQTKEDLEKIVVKSGRGGRTLLTLGECFAAEAVLRRIEALT